MCSHIARSAYVHIPFCLSKCSYCDFNSYTGLEHLHVDYIDSLILEIQKYSSNTPLDTVYFGGGTPTLLEPGLLINVLDKLEQAFGLSNSAEVTIEANPGTLNLEHLQKLKSAGFNRLSIGIQSFNDSLLLEMGRQHNSKSALEAYHIAREAGFGNIGIDIIYGYPGETMEVFEADLQAIVRLKPEHISIYELTVSKETKLGEAIALKLVQAPDQDLQLEMFELGSVFLEKSGYYHYEVSNFALEGFQCRHNIAYWSGANYYGFGAGASGFLDGTRYSNVKKPAEYIEAVQSGRSPVAFAETPDLQQRIAEMVMLAMRTTAGLDLDNFERLLGFRFEEANKEQIKSIISRGLAVLENGALRPTWQGMLLADEIAKEWCNL